MTSQASLFQFEDDGADLDKLTAAEREVYEAVEIDGYGPRPYARRTERSPGTVSNLLRRAREKLGEGDHGE